MRPFLEEVRTNCLGRYNPNVNTSVDEAMVAFRGRLAFRQYMPGKPTKYGIKVWVRADPANGYLNDFQVYTGKSDDGRAEDGLAARVVMDLMRPILNNHHIVNMDNYFSSPALYEKLLDENTYARGTVRSNRKNYPSATLHPRHLQQQRQSKIAQKGSLVAVAWRDKKVIHFLTTADSPTDIASVERRGKDGNRMNVPCPKVVPEYNSNMNGVDRADQIRTEYPTYRSSEKWWHHLFWFLWDVAIANAFILRKESPNHRKLTRGGNEKVLKQVEFRMALAKQLIGNTRSQHKRRLTPSLDPTGNGHLPMRVPKRGRCRHCSSKGIRRESKLACVACNHSLCLECFEPYHRKLMID